MARYAYNGTVRDRQGYAIASATVTVYEADGTTGATIYEAKTGGSAVADSTATSDTGGRYTFYVDDADYLSGDQFDLTVTKSGYSTWTMNDETVF
jgi:hypothetical protein